MTRTPPQPGDMTTGPSGAAKEAGTPVLYVNGEEWTGESMPSTVAELLAALDVDPRRVAVEVNERLVPRAAHARCRLAAGDHVEVVSLVGGG